MEPGSIYSGGKSNVFWKYEAVLENYPITPRNYRILATLKYPYFSHIGLICVEPMWNG